jgi:hypothetical protein
VQALQAESSFVPTWQMSCAHVLPPQQVGSAAQIFWTHGSHAVASEEPVAHLLCAQVLVVATSLHCSLN